MVMLGTIAAAADTKTFDSVQVTRTVPDHAAPGEQVEVILDFINTGTVSKTLAITQVLSPDADFDKALLKTTVVSHTGEGRTCFGANCSSPPAPGSFSEYTVTISSYQWTMALAPGERRQIRYRVSPRTTGQYLMRPVSIVMDGMEYFLPAATVQVSCSSGHVCDSSKGENALTCPQNCANWSADNICNQEKDGQCDPDCRAGADPDCGTPTTRPTSAPLLPATAAAAVLAGTVWYCLKRKEKGS